MQLAAVTGEAITQPTTTTIVRAIFNTRPHLFFPNMGVVDLANADVASTLLVFMVCTVNLIFSESFRLFQFIYAPSVDIRETSELPAAYIYLRIDRQYVASYSAQRTVVPASVVRHDLHGLLHANSTALPHYR